MSCVVDYFASLSGCIFHGSSDLLGPIFHGFSGIGCRVFHLLGAAAIIHRLLSHTVLGEIEVLHLCALFRFREAQPLCAAELLQVIQLGGRLGAILPLRFHHAVVEFCDFFIKLRECQLYRGVILDCGFLFESIKGST